MTYQQRKMNLLIKPADEEVDEKIEHEKIYYQKSQPEVTRRLNIALMDNYINPQNMKTSHGNRTYASTTKLGKEY